MVKSMQASLEKILYDGRRVQCDDDIEIAPVSIGSVVGSTASPSDDAVPAAPAPTQSSNSDCVLLDAGSTPAKGPLPDLEVLDPVLASPCHEKIRKRRSYEANKHFQDSWAAKLSWAESVIGADGKVSQVRCRICTAVEGREKLLIPKIDSLWKHAGRRRALVNVEKVKKGNFYFLSTNVHVKNERIYFSRGGDTVLQQVAQGVVQERKRKEVQFRLLFHVFSLGRPMTDFAASKVLFQQLNVPNFPLKHWNEASRWNMASSMATVISERTKTLIKEARFLAISADEVTTVDNQSWLSLHIYVCRAWKRVPILLCLQRLLDGQRADLVKETIVSALDLHGGVTEKDLSERLVCFGTDGDSVFQGCNTRVTVQLKSYNAPYMFGVHCMAHRTNLVVQTLSNLPLVAKVETLCERLYNYFTVSPKRHLEFTKLVDVVETGGLKLLRNVKTRWISVLEPLKRIMVEYKTLIVKMAEDAAVKNPNAKDKEVSAKARNNLDLLCDVGTLLALPCLTPLLESVESLIKFA